MKCKHKTLIFIAGLLWLAIGVFLMSLGIHFIMETVKDFTLSQIPGRFSIACLLKRFVSDHTQAIMLSIVLALVLGYIKGRMALGKSVQRQIKRIHSLPNPAHIKYLYSKGYYFLIAAMIALGMLMRFFPITLDTRGAIDITIGSALINGAMLYFRAMATKVTLKQEEEGSRS